MSDVTALLIAVTYLYSTGHWIGATVLLAWLLSIIWQQINDPLGTKAFFSALRGYR